MRTLENTRGRIRLGGRYALLALSLVSLFLMACSSQAGSPGSTTGNSPAAPMPRSEPAQLDQNGAVSLFGPSSNASEWDSAGDARFALIGSGVSGENASGGFRNSASSLSTGESGSVGIFASGTGKATSAPDLAILRLGVQDLANTVGEARTAAATAMTAVIDSVKEDGVEEKDIQTGRYSIQPRYTGREVTRCVQVESDDMEETQMDPTPTPGGTTSIQGGETGKSASAEECFQEYKSVITGYEVSNDVTVLVRDLESIDDVIDGAVEAGGDSIRFNGLSFTLEDSTDLMEDARAEAVADLKDKAGQLATLGGVELGDIVYLSETTPSAAPVVRAEFALAKASFDEGAGVSTPVSPGEVTVQVQVKGQYLITYPIETDSTEEDPDGEQGGGS